MTGGGHRAPRRTCFYMEFTSFPWQFIVASLAVSCGKLYVHMQVINHVVNSHPLSLENRPAAANSPQPVVEMLKPTPVTKEPTPPLEKTATAALASPPQPVVEVSERVPLAKEAAPQAPAPPEKAATSAAETEPAPVTAHTSASASATAEAQRSAVGQSGAAATKHRAEAAPSAAPVDTAAPAVRDEAAEQQQQKQQESQQEPEVAQSAPAEPQQSAKEPGPKRKKGFSFFGKREKCVFCPHSLSIPPAASRLEETTVITSSLLCAWLFQH